MSKRTGTFSTSNEKGTMKIKNSKSFFKLLSGTSVDLLTLYVCRESMWTCERFFKVK